LTSAHESMGNLTRRIREALIEMRHTPLFQDSSHSTFERMILDRIVREIELLEQQQRTVLIQASQSVARFEQGSSNAALQTPEDQLPLQVRSSSLQQRRRPQSQANPLLEQGLWEPRPARTAPVTPATDNSFLYMPSGNLSSQPVTPLSNRTEDL